MELTLRHFSGRLTTPWQVLETAHGLVLETGMLLWAHQTLACFQIWTKFNAPNVYLLEIFELENTPVNAG